MFSRSSSLFLLNTFYSSNLSKGLSHSLTHSLTLIDSIGTVLDVVGRVLPDRYMNQYFNILRQQRAISSDSPSRLYSL